MQLLKNLSKLKCFICKSVETQYLYILEILEKYPKPFKLKWSVEKKTEKLWYSQQKQRKQNQNNLTENRIFFIRFL